MRFVTDIVADHDKITGGIVGVIGCGAGNALAIFVVGVLADSGFVCGSCGGGFC